MIGLAGFLMKEKTKGKKVAGKKGSRIRAVRELLRSAPDGMTPQELMEKLPKIEQAHMSRILRGMPDAYIDRWVNVQGDRWHRAVWCVVIPPEDCPRPFKKDEYL
jgi:hypothetical protein